MKIKNCKLKISNSAFTLIEIMIAIAIIGILSAVVLVSMKTYGVKARASRALAQASGAIPSLVSCAGNGGTPAFSGDICSLGSSYGSWPTFPSDYGVAASNWTSASSWYFTVTSANDSQKICCNSKMSSCGMSDSCSASATW